jgi:hypothetical protein
MSRRLSAFEIHPKGTSLCKAMYKWIIITETQPSLKPLGVLIGSPTHRVIVSLRSIYPSLLFPIVLAPLLPDLPV